MTLDEIKENWGDNPDVLEPHVKFMKDMKFENPDTKESTAIKKVWEEMASNKTDSQGFFHCLLKKILASDPAAAIWCSKIEDGDEDTYMSAEYEIEVDGKFDVSKLEFINFDEEFEGEPLESYASHDMILLNAIIYDGKMYFAKGHTDMEDGCDGDDFIEDSGIIEATDL